METGESPPLGHKALASPREVLRHFGGSWQDRRAVLANRKGWRQIFLQRDFAIELGVADPVGDAETALTEHFEDLIATDDAARRQRHIVDDSIGGGCRLDRLGRLFAGIVLDMHVTPAPVTQRPRNAGVPQGPARAGVVRDASMAFKILDAEPATELYKSEIRIPAAGTWVALGAGILVVAAGFAWTIL